MYVFGNGRAIHTEKCAMLRSARQRQTVLHEVKVCSRTTVDYLLAQPQGQEFMMQRRVIHRDGCGCDAFLREDPVRFFRVCGQCRGKWKSGSQPVDDGWELMDDPVEDAEQEPSGSSGAAASGSGYAAAAKQEKPEEAAAAAKKAKPEEPPASQDADAQPARASRSVEANRAIARGRAAEQIQVFLEREADRERP